MDAAPCYDLFGRRLDEILSGLFVPRPKSDGRVRRRRDLLLEAASDLHQLGKALHREQERRVRSARGLKNLREVAVPKWRELVQHNREDRAILPPPVCLVLVTFTHGELDILQQHLPKRPHGLGVLVGVQAHEQNQLLIDDVFDRQQVVILSGDGGKFIVEERHALVDETLDLGHALAVLERLHQVLDAHLEVEPLLGGNAGVAIQAIYGLFDLVLQHVLIEQHYDHVVKVVACAGVEQNADDVAQIVQLVLGEELVVQIETAEYHAHLRHVVVVTREERVVQGRELGAGRIEQPQLVQSAGTVNVRQAVARRIRGRPCHRR